MKVGFTASAVPGSYAYQDLLKPNRIPSQADQILYRRNSAGKEVDLYDNISIPITYTILDVREPDKRKTSWSKTIRIPGTKNNNRIFGHIYQISADSWITIGGKSVYQGFNPNIRMEVVILNDGVQVMKGNMQLKSASKDSDGHIEYEVAINGDLTSLFYDVGNAKLSDLEWSEWDHDWSRENIVNSWSGVVKKDGVSYNNITRTSRGTISEIKMSGTGRLQFKTSSPNNIVEGDWVRIEPNGFPYLTGVSQSFAGEWKVVEKNATNTFTVNYFYPVSLPATGVSASNLGTVYDMKSKGEGYVYPMISWGDEYDYNSFPVTSFVPGFYVKEIWNKIFAETNSSYDSNFLDSEFFNRLILIQRRPTYDLNPSEVAERKFCVGLTASYMTGLAFSQAQKWYYLNFTNQNTSATASIFPQVNSNYVPFKKELGSVGTASFVDSGNNWDEDTYKWVVQNPGEYQLRVTMKFTGWMEMDGFIGSPGTGTASMNPGDPLYEYRPGNNYANVSSQWSSAGCGARVNVTIKHRRAGVTNDIGNWPLDHFYANLASKWEPTNTNWKRFGLYQPANWENFVCTFTSTNTYFAKDDEVWVEVKYYLQAQDGDTYLTTPTRKNAVLFNEIYKTPGDMWERTAIGGNFYLKVLETSYIFNDPSPKSSENSIIQAASFVPKDLTCKDFLLAIIKTFNLHIEPDKQIERKYYIEPRDDYYRRGTSTTDFVDWTDKIDNSTVEIIPVGELTGKYFTFENKEETDYWNKKFKDDRGRPYMKYTKEVENDFTKNEVKITIPLGSTVMSNNPTDSDVVMPIIVQKDATGNKPVSNSAPRMLIWSGIKPYTAQRGGAPIPLQNAQTSYVEGWEMLSSVNVAGSVSATAGVPYTYYPYAGTVDSPTDPYHDINWFNMESGDFVYWDSARWTNANLYNEYWSNFIEEISNPASKLVRVSLWLTPKDIYNLDFRKIYVIDGNWLRLQKVVDYDAVGGGLTKCEFLKLTNLTKFRRQSVIKDAYGIVNDQFDTNDVVSPNPVSATNIQYIPQRKRPEFGFNNTSYDSDVANSSTIQTTGLSNFVAASSKNININGNENAVGNNTRNISITNGNGNFVASGMQNVNLIGTDKKVVTESDVTYINGVRYKYGVPISRANVINGGEDLSFNKSSNNTTANVINGGEDVVIANGSSTYENVINSGEDAILPDVPELGFGTLSNPNPRTNLSGGFDVIGATLSIVEQIRQKALIKS